ncbi:VOC family protein [Oleiharenicola lentus]|uniref:VOC family protein n=1 Tax=Oleiharenicola lentus TaxID=2508720 RepID=UPI003F67707E
MKTSKNRKRASRAKSSKIDGLEFAQVCWVVPNLRAAVKFISGALGVSGFPKPTRMNAEKIQMSYRGQLVPGKWITTQAFNGHTFLEIVQPLSGQSMFHDYLAQHPEGGIQHVAFRLPIAGFERVTAKLRKQGHAIIGEVDHPIAHMTFFDTYATQGVATEIMGVKADGWKAIKELEKAC